MMLLTPESIQDEVDRLEIRYLANPDSNLRYALLSDFSDAPQPRMPEDAERLDIAIRGIEQLNAKYPSARFLLFHRDRGWSETEGRWMGWERKRGKLEQLNAFLMELQEGGTDKEADSNPKSAGETENGHSALFPPMTVRAGDAESATREFGLLSRWTPIPNCPATQAAAGGNARSPAQSACPRKGG